MLKGLSARTESVDPDENLDVQTIIPNLCDASSVSLASEIRPLRPRNSESEVVCGLALIFFCGSPGVCAYSTRGTIPWTFEFSKRNLEENLKMKKEVQPYLNVRTDRQASTLESKISRAQMLTSGRSSPSMVGISSETVG
jgi:hypothetical protein